MHFFLFLFLFCSCQSSSCFSSCWSVSSLNSPWATVAFSLSFQWATAHYEATFKIHKYIIYNIYILQWLTYTLIEGEEPLWEVSVLWLEENKFTRFPYCFLSLEVMSLFFWYFRFFPTFLVISHILLCSGAHLAHRGDDRGRCPARQGGVYPYKIWNYCLWANGNVQSKDTECSSQQCTGKHSSCAVLLTMFLPRILRHPAFPHPVSMQLQSLCFQTGLKAYLTVKKKKKKAFVK